MFIYYFDYTAGTYTLNHSFRPSALQIGEVPKYKLHRPFAGQAVYHMGRVRITARPFQLAGFFRGSDAESDVEDLREALTTGTKLYSEDGAGANDAYVDINGASPPIILPITHLAIKVVLHFWPAENSWRLVSDDSKTVI